MNTTRQCSWSAKYWFSVFKFQFWTLLVGFHVYWNTVFQCSMNTTIQVWWSIKHQFLVFTFHLEHCFWVLILHCFLVIQLTCKPVFSVVTPLILGLQVLMMTVFEHWCHTNSQCWWTLKGSVQLFGTNYWCWSCNYTPNIVRKQGIGFWVI